MERVSETDILVIGGGTAGFGAAVTAGRLGLRVTLLEASQKIGGVMSFCPGMPWGAGYPTGRSIGGILEELTQRLGSKSPPAAERRDCTLENFGDEILYDHDAAIAEMFEMLAEARVDLRLGATAFAPDMNGALVKAMRCFDRLGPFELRPKIVIDCSGDGDISAKAGVPFSLGDQSGNMMGVSLTFHMLDVDWQQAFAKPDPYFTEYAERGIAQGRLHPDLAKLYLMKGFHANTVFCNSVVIRGVDGTNPQAVTDATQEGRRRCLELAAFLRADVPGFEKARMAMLGPTVGVRETRKLEAIYKIRSADLAGGRKFTDGIVACDNPVDDVMRADSSMTHEAAIGKGGYYTIPLRSLIPEKIGNLMFAGRIISADDVAFASVRGMPQCMAMGQAVAVAASLAIAKGCAVQEVDPDAVIADLVELGVKGLAGNPL